jgi:hypothetical protein
VNVARVLVPLDLEGRTVLGADDRVFCICKLIFHLVFSICYRRRKRQGSFPSDGCGSPATRLGAVMTA